jgi:hypothetical protein
MPSRSTLSLLLSFDAVSKITGMSVGDITGD